MCTAMRTISGTFLNKKKNVSLDRGQGSTKFTKMKKPPLNSRQEKSDMKQVLY
jgi:hypothetical protein